MLLFAYFRRLLRVVFELEHYRYDALFAKLVANAEPCLNRVTWPPDGCCGNTMPHCVANLTPTAKVVRVLCGMRNIDGDA